MVYGPIHSDLIWQVGFLHVYHVALSDPSLGREVAFPCNEYKSVFKVQPMVPDWDYLLSNDHVGDATFMVSELLVDTSQMDPVTGLYDDDVDGKHPMKEFKLLLSTAKEMLWVAKHNSVITFQYILLLCL